MMTRGNPISGNLHMILITHTHTLHMEPEKVLQSQALERFSAARLMQKCQDAKIANLNGNSWTNDHMQPLQALETAEPLPFQPFPTRPLVQYIWTRSFLVSHLSVCILEDLQSMHLSQTEKTAGTSQMIYTGIAESKLLHIPKTSQKAVQR